MRNTKIRILAVERILCDTPKNSLQIINELYDKYEIVAERKAIYDDIACLTKYYNIQKEHGKGFFKISMPNRIVLKKDFSVGKWLLKTSKYGYWYECSNCGRHWPLNAQTHICEKTKHCPDCGVRLYE